MHVLILGGTSEASALAQFLSAHPSIRATLSLAGRTRNPVLPPIPHRIGGFGGADGLAAWLREHRISALIDATHPFAGRMPFNAAQAADAAGIPRLTLLRPQWRPQAGDDWLEVDGHRGAAAALGFLPRRVFLTVGRLELDAYAQARQHFYLARSIDPVESNPLENAVRVTARPPFTPEGEAALMTQHAIDALITKNSGGSATEAKLAAARRLGLPVILVRRPSRPEGECVASAPEALEWIARVHGVSL